MKTDSGFTAGVFVYLYIGIRQQSPSYKSPQNENPKTGSPKLHEKTVITFDPKLRTADSSNNGNQLFHILKKTVFIQKAPCRK